MRRRASLLVLAAAAAVAQEDAYWHGESIQPIHVVIAANRAHRAGLLNVVASAVNATGVDAERLRFLLLAPKGEGEGLAKEAFCAARRRGRVVAREFSPQLINNPEALSANSRLAEPLNYARFFVDQLLPADAATAIYLDSDVTVRASLAALGASSTSRLAYIDILAILGIRPDSVKRMSQIQNIS